MESIKSHAIDLGFDDFAWIPAQKLNHTLDILEKRKSLKYDLDIEEEDLLKRVDPRLSLPSVETVMVGFVQIPIAEKLSVVPGYGNLASLSWGLDYHRLLAELFDKLIIDLKEKYPREEFVYQVDTGPLCERSFASETGLGRIGRHGNFIHTRLGSYVAIGLILTSLKLEGEPKQLEGICGSCKRCVKICPGGAIGEGGDLNPKKCVSWLTQKKGELTEAEAKAIGSSLYGCDLCQWVCPQNKGIIKKDLGPWGDLRKRVDLRSLADLSNREFKKTYGQVSGAWRGKKVWLRNAQAILKNQLSTML